MILTWFRYSRRQKTMMSGGDTDGGTSSRSNEGTVYGAVRSARRESARRKNMVSDQSDIIEDLYLETEHSDTGSRIGKERSGMRRKEMESLFEVQTHNTTINFSLISQTCASKGWIANQGDSELKDKSLVMYLLERLQKCKMNKAMEVKQLNQMRFPAMIKYYSELDSEPYKTRRPFSWSARHKIGFVTEVPQNINSQFIFAFPDGSTTLYYPNGSICAILSNFAMPKEQELTRTVNIFHHIQPGFIVASFNPSGVGSCWYDSKSPAFLSTILGGCIYDKAGVTCKSWSWNNIDTEDFLLPINDVVSLYFTAAGEVNLHLQLAEECICLNVKTAKTPLEDSTQNPTLLSTVAFNSVTAQTILNAPKTRGRRKMRQKRVSSTRVTDDSETEEILYPHKHSLADPTDRHLINTTRKVTKNVEEFLLFFRQELSLGRTSQRVSRNTSVAKAGPVKSESTLLKMPEGYQSLPKGCRKKTCVTMNLNCAPYLVFPERGDANKKKMCKGGRGSSATSRRVKLTRRRLTATCPAALRVLALTGEETMCKCDWRVVPMVTDAEFDRLIAECAPQQLVIVSVYSSKHPEATPCDAMVEEIFYGINYSRSQPCVQSVQDKYRLLRYDISTNNLLKNRHNAIPGMFFIYCNARILFSDLIFNGYGTAKKDFMKQVFKCGKLAEEGKFLPEDFKFTGMKSWDEADDTVRQVLTLQFGKTSGWIAPKLTPLTRREDMTLFGW